MARQNFIGLVVSQGKMNKTIKVQVERKTFNRIINKVCSYIFNTVKIIFILILDAIY